MCCMKTKIIESIELRSCFLGSQDSNEIVFIYQSNFFFSDGPGKKLYLYIWVFILSALAVINTYILIISHSIVLFIMACVAMCAALAMDILASPKTFILTRENLYHFEPFYFSPKTIPLHQIRRITKSGNYFFQYLDVHLESGKKFIIDTPILEPLLKLNLKNIDFPELPLGPEVNLQNLFKPLKVILWLSALLALLGFLLFLKPLVLYLISE